MRHDRHRAVRLAVFGLTGAGWLVGLFSQVLTRESVGSMDIFPAQLLLGIALCLGAGAAARLAGPRWRTVRRGAAAGVGMAASIVAGYLVLVTLLWNEAWSGQGGETWVTFLLELPFWLGIPLVTGAVSGVIGWSVTDRVAGSSTA